MSQPQAPASETTGTVFISYRREDSAAHAGRLYDAMLNRFGEAQVFMDIEMAPGVDFVDRITELVGTCKVLIEVIGPDWATIADDGGRARIADPDDYVRLELETALGRPDVIVVPVLVDGARMPARDELPDGLRTLHRRNALELSEGRWRYDIGRLIEAIEKRIAGTDPEPEPEPSKTLALSWQTILVGTLVAAIAAYLGWKLAKTFDIHLGHNLGEEGSIKESRIKPASNVVRLWTLPWMFVGGALGVWIAIQARQRDYGRRGLLGLLGGTGAGLIGSLAYVTPVFFLQDGEFTRAHAVETDLAEALIVASFAITGASIGALIAAWCSPRRIAVGLASGAVAAVLIELLLGELAGPGFALCAAAITGATLAVLTATARREMS